MTRPGITITCTVLLCSCVPCAIVVGSVVDRIAVDRIQFFFWFSSSRGTTFGCSVIYFPSEARRCVFSGYSLSIDSHPLELNNLFNTQDIIFLDFPERTWYTHLIHFAFLLAFAIAV